MAPPANLWPLLITIFSLYRAQELLSAGDWTSLLLLTRTYLALYCSISHTVRSLPTRSIWWDSTNQDARCDLPEMTRANRKAAWRFGQPIADTCCLVLLCLWETYGTFSLHIVVIEPIKRWWEAGQSGGCMTFRLANHVGAMALLSEGSLYKTSECIWTH